MSDDSRQTLNETAGRGLGHWLGQFLDRLGLRGGGTAREEIVEALAEANGELADLSVQERAMLTNVLSLRERRVGDVMVPRADIVAVPADVTLDELLSRFSTAGHSRLPVFDDSLDDPRGMIHIRDFLEYLGEKALPEGRAADDGEPAAAVPHDLSIVDLTTLLSATKLLRPVLYVPPSMPAVDLLVRMQATRTHIALVIDEYGGTDGLVSIEDLIEIIVGEIEDEHDLDEAPIAAAGDNCFTADARATLEDLREATGVDLSGNEVADDIDTLGGLIVTLAGKVPVAGEVVEGPEGLSFEVLDSDQRRVKRLTIRRRDGTQAQEAAMEPG